ncbi:MAG: EMC3/TMCO1 family protein [Candidatus Bathyarchaeia archaeon]
MHINKGISTILIISILVLSFLIYLVSVSQVKAASVNEGILQDTAVNYGNPATNYGDSDPSTGALGNFTMTANGTVSFSRLLLDLNFSEISPSYTLGNVTLNVYQCSDDPTTSPDYFDITAYDLLSSFNEGTVAWNTMPSYNASLYSNTITINDSTSGWQTLNITSICSAVRTANPFKTSQFTDIYIVLIPFNSNASVSYMDSFLIYGQDISNSSLAPYVTITYTIQPILKEIPYSALLILGLASLISLLTTAVNRLLTNPEQTKSVRREVTEWSKELRQAQRDKDKKAIEKLMKKQSYMMQIQTKMMWQSMKVTLLFIVPLLLMWQVLGGFYGGRAVAYLPGIGANLPLPIFSSSLIWFYLLCSLLFGTTFSHVLGIIEVSE